MSVSWQQLVADKRRRQADAIPKEWLITPPPDTVLDVTQIPESCGLLSARELEITNAIDVATILHNLATAKWSSVEVTTAFYKRAIVAQQLVNCLTEIFVERALARAAELDAILKDTGKVVGPLHGLPISLKDQICIEGLEATIGYVSWIGKYAERNAVLVDLLQEAGAVPFVRTNVPQTLMWSETFNSVFGRTLNPYNRKLTCGGSSGGEGALVGLKGSPLGVGSDVGGSIRIPSSFNGLYGLRPSCGRVPYAGSVNTLEGQDSIPSVLGPMSNSLSGMKLFMQAVAAGKPWLKDPLSRRAPWSDAEYSLSEHGGGKKLCFGIMWHNGHVVPHPPITRALETTKAALLAAGHEVIDWEPYRNKELYDVTSRIWTAASDEDYNAVTSLTNEPLINSMDPAAEAEIVQNAFLPAQQNVSAYQVWQNHKAKAAMRQEHMQKWNETVKITGTGRPVDAIITPAVAYVAPPHGKNYSAEYTAVWNALDYTACVFPVTKVDPVLDAKRPPHEFLNATDKKNYEFYDPETFWNAPVSLQLVGRAQEEEAVIAMTEIVDAALKEQVAPKL